MNNKEYPIDPIIPETLKKIWKAYKEKGNFYDTQRVVLDK